MGPLRIAEIRGAWVTWVAVSLTFIATGFAVTLPLLVVSSLNWAADQGLLVGEDVLALQVIPWFNLFLVVLAALSVVGAATGLVIEARRAGDCADRTGRGDPSPGAEPADVATERDRGGGRGGR